MAVMTTKQLNSAISAIRKARVKMQELVHEALVSATFYAMKDGNVTPFNQLLDAVGQATHIKGITMWAELNAPVIVREGAFTLNKTAKKEIHIENVDDFAPYEADIRQQPKWYEVAPKQKAESIFMPDSYLGKVADKLEREGFAELALQIRAVKGKYEMDLIDAVEGVVIEPVIQPAPLAIAA